MFTITFGYDTEAFDGTADEADAECARILVHVVRQIREGEVASLVLDREGKPIGRWSRNGQVSPNDDRCPNCGAMPPYEGGAYLATCQRCGYGQAHPPTNPIVTAGEAVDALLTIERLRVRADELRLGDRVVYERGGVIRVDAVTAVIRWQRAHAAAVLVIKTESGDYWPCPPESRDYLRVAG